MHEDLIHEAVATHPQQTADIVVGLGWSVVDADELVEFLQRCVDLAVRVVGGADSAGVTATVQGEPFTAVHTDARTLEVDRHQYEAGDGPCLRAMRSGEVVQVDVATSRAEWPEFTSDAEAAGIHSFLASPLGTEAECLGALNLYSTSPDGFTEDDRVLLRVLVAHAVRALGDYSRLRAATDLAAQLREAMASRAPIEQAKGILRAAHGVDDAGAFALLREESQRTNVKLRDVAVRFVGRHSAVPSGRSAERA